MSAVDTLIATKIIHLLVQDFSQWDAFKKGIIDAHGQLIIHNPATMTQDQHEAWTMLHRLVWRLKLILAKVPMANNKFASFATAYLLVRESLERDVECEDYYTIFEAKVKCISKEELALVEEVANSVGAAGVSGLETKEPSPTEAETDNFKINNPFGEL